MVVKKYKLARSNSSWHISLIIGKIILDYLKNNSKDLTVETPDKVDFSNIMVSLSGNHI